MQTPVRDESMCEMSARVCAKHSLPSTYICSNICSANSSSMASLSRSHSHVFTGCAYRVHSVNDLEPYCLPGKRVVEIFAFHTRLHALALALSLSLSVRWLGSAHFICLLVYLPPLKFYVRIKCRRVSRANKRAALYAAPIAATAIGKPTKYVFLQRLLEWNGGKRTK